MALKPEDCKNIEEIRQEIDKIDEEIIKLIGKRHDYVKAASKFKKNQNSVKAPDRVKSMLEVRKSWAKREGLNPEVIEQIYKTLVSYFINEEMKHWKNKTDNTD